MSNLEHSRLVVNPSTYSSLLLLLYGIGILGLLFIIGAIVSFAIDSIDRSMTILLVGVVFLSLVALAIDLLERKLGPRSTSNSQRGQDGTRLPNGTHNIAYTPDDVESKPPRYSEIMREDEAPPSYDAIENTFERNNNASLEATQTE